MTQKTTGFFTIVCCVMVFISCSPRITGTWTVQRYETTTPGEQTVSLSNVGTMEFHKNGTGNKKLNYSILGIQRDDQLPFIWTWDNGKYVSIKSDGSDFSKTWIIISNKRKFQQWKSTDGSNNIQILELKK